MQERRYLRLQKFPEEKPKAADFKQPAVPIRGEPKAAEQPKASQQPSAILTKPPYAAKAANAGPQVPPPFDSRYELSKLKIPMPLSEV